MVSGDHLLLVGGVDWTAPNPDIIAVNLSTLQWSLLHLTLVGGTHLHAHSHCWPVLCVHVDKAIELGIW